MEKPIEYHLLPESVVDVLRKYEDQDNGYDFCANLNRDLESIGWTIDWGLDGIPYNLRSKEIRVYGIHNETDLWNNAPDDPEIGWENAPDEEFINEAEAQGNVWSLQGFQEDFNRDEIHYSLIIRIV